MVFVVRAALSVLLLLGIYLLAAGMVVMLGVAVYEGLTHGLAGIALGKGVVLLLVLLLGLTQALWAARRSSAFDPGGLPLTASAQPRLWEEVRAIATTVGTRPPDEIRLVPEVNASVAEDSRWLGLVGGRRVMTIGAPLMMGLTVQQLRSVLAHELAHYSHRHTALAPIAYRGQVTIGHIVSRLGRDSLAGKAFAAYGWLYLRLTRGMSRRQEMEADVWSARIAGRTAATRAMREIAALGALWDFFVEDHAFAVDRVRPDDLFGGFRQLLASPVRQGEMDVLRREVPDEETDAYDSHPSRTARIAFFESRPDDGIRDDGESAVGVLDRSAAVLMELEDALFADSDLEPRPWSSVAESAGLIRARQRAALLVRASREAGLGAADLRQAIVALGRGNPRSLVQPYITMEMSTDEVDALARGLVQAAISAALVQYCGARFDVDWDTNDALLDPDGHRIDVAGLVGDTTDMEAAQRLIRTLGSEGVPMEFAVDPAAADAEARPHPAEPVVESVASCAHRRRLRILVVAESALIVKRLGWVESLAAVFRHGSTDGRRTALRYVASMPLPRLLEDPRAEVYSWDQVGPASLSGRLLALTLDGKVRRVRVYSHLIAGDLVGSLRHHLGERLAVA